jgi:anti-anti-sigma factor
MFKTTTSKINGARLLQLQGRLDTLAGNDLYKQLSELVNAENALIIDAAGCTYLSSSGIRVLLSAFKQMKSKGGKLILCSLQPEVLQVLEMVGLHNVFSISNTAHDAIDIINNEAGIQLITLGDDDMPFTYHQTCNVYADAIIFKNDLAAFGELGLSFGVGAFNESNQAESKGLFFTLGNCIGFFPANNAEEADFRITLDQNMFAAHVNFGISFSKNISGRLSAKKSSIFAFSKIDTVIDELVPQIEVIPDVLSLLIFSIIEGKPAISFVAKFEGIQNIEGANEWFELVADANKGSLAQKWTGITFILSEGHQAEHDVKVFDWLAQMLSIENVMEVRPFDVGKALFNPSVFLIACQKMVNACDLQLKIETDDGLELSKSNRFLIRSLYADSKKIIVKPLHGGFSAQTFAVSSFDNEGRKLRPTVLKIASKQMIAREADCCHKHAMPYILNNSAMVLGAVFMGEMGALRYNFVGIGGEQSKLKWLTNYYTDWSYEQLAPLFDKIFVEILHPWYGQPVQKTIFPFADHDPTRTFFPHIYETAEQVLGVSSNEQFIDVAETGEKMLNPYWFLKNEYPKHESLSINFLSSICHGDLNMQNILLDEAMNVYLIDFSETRPRSVVSDFARLEAIFMIDFATVNENTDFSEYLLLMKKMYNTDLFFDESLLEQVTQEPELKKNMALSFKMRQYAQRSANGFDTVLAYYMALLEWVLPVVCYRETFERKRLSMIVASLLCAEVMKLSRIG